MVRLIASEKNWIEGAAVEQLHKTAQLPDVVEAIGMPDLHPGKDGPIGAVFATETYIYPHLVDRDIGCGIGLWQLELPWAKTTTDKLDRRLGSELDGAWNGEVDSILRAEGIEKSTPFDSALGTIGHGNHFAEVSRVKAVHDEERFSSLSLKAKNLYLLIHSGSRGFGESIFMAHASRFGNAGLPDCSEEGRAYLAAHDHALAWARANRRLIAERFMAAICTTGERILDVSHNHVRLTGINGHRRWLHRKGAAATEEGAIVIAGSRGSLSYLVEGIGDQRSNLATVAHGAGRKWRRSECRERLRNRFSKSDFLKTQLGSRVICDDKDLLYEEAPEAYKNIDVVVDDLKAAGLIRVIAAFAPVVTYKKRKER